MNEHEHIANVAHDLYFKMHAIKGIAHMMLADSEVQSADFHDQLNGAIHAISQMACYGVRKFEDVE